MRIIYMSLVFPLCWLVSAKYVPEESSSRVLLQKQRSMSYESNISIGSAKDDTNSNNHNSDTFERKQIEQRLKLQEERDAKDKKRLKKEHKLRQKHLEKECKLQESLQKAEDKWKVILEKEEHKREEKLTKEELKPHENLHNLLEKIHKESMQISENLSKSPEANNSMDQGEIWKRYIYSKYALSADSNELDRAAIFNRYLQEELGLDVNSTSSEYRKAVLQIIQNKLSNNSTRESSLHNYLVSHVNDAYIQRISAELDTKIAKLDNETARFLQNVSSPWVTKVQETIKQKKNILKSVKQYLTNMVPIWITEGQATSTNANGTNVDSSATISSTIATLTPRKPAISLPNVAVSDGKRPVNGSIGEKSVNNALSQNSESSSDVTLSSAITGVSAVTTVFAESFISGANVSVADPTLATLVTSSDASASAMNSSNAALSNTSTLTSNDTIISVAPNNVVPTEVVDIAEVFPTFSFAEAFTEASTTNLVEEESIHEELARPTEVTLNSSIDTVANKTVVKEDSTSFESFVVNDSGNKSSLTNSAVSTTEVGIVTDTENSESMVSASPLPVVQANVTHEMSL